MLFARYVITDKAHRDHASLCRMGIVCKSRDPSTYLDIVMSFLIANSPTVDKSSRSEMEYDLRT